MIAYTSSPSYEEGIPIPRGRMEVDFDMKVSLVGPSAENVTGSLLRPLSIYNALSRMESINLSYIPIERVVQILTIIPDIVQSDLMIVSGVAPWVAALIVLLRRLLGEITIIDVHGSAWYESSIMAYGNAVYRLISFFSEYVSYKSPSLIVVASCGLKKILTKYFKVKKVYTIPNPVNPLFTKIAQALKHGDKKSLRKLIKRRIMSGNALVGDIDDKLLLVAPLPSIFQANVEALNMLEKVIDDLPESITIIVTGVKRPTLRRGLVYVGYIAYTDYVALMLASNAVILPYPEKAVCGGIRNKVLEAGYCSKLVISTRTGMLYTNARPWIDYIPFSEHIIKDLPYYIKNLSIAKNLHNKIIKNNSIEFFYLSWLRILLTILRLWM